MPPPPMSVWGFLMPGFSCNHRMVLGPLGAAKPLPLGQGACRPSQVNMSLREFATCFLQLTNKLRSIVIFPTRHNGTRLGILGWVGAGHI